MKFLHTVVTQCQLIFEYRRGTDLHRIVSSHNNVATTSMQTYTCI